MNKRFLAFVTSKAAEVNLTMTIIAVLCMLIMGILKVNTMYVRSKSVTRFTDLRQIWVDQRFEGAKRQTGKH